MCIVPNYQYNTTAHKYSTWIDQSMHVRVYTGQSATIVISM
jgi:hypothetical protein